jgi:hypothetical protein
MGLFDLFRKKPQQTVKSAAQDSSDDVFPEGWSRGDILKLAQWRYETLNDSIKLIGTTVVPHTFFSRYEIALREAKYLAKLCPWDEMGKHASQLVRFLEVNRKQNIKDFLDRCNAEHKLPFIKQEITQRREEMPPECYDYFCRLLGQTKVSVEQKEYIFCSVVFQERGKFYYYLTNNKNIRRGDQVSVPVGKLNEPTTGRVVKVETFKGGDAPVPVEALKWVIDVIP